MAVYLTCESKKGMSAMQLHRMLGVQYDTAWYTNHRIRNATMQTELPALGGVVEMHEARAGSKGGNDWQTRKAMGAGQFGQVKPPWRCYRTAVLLVNLPTGRMVIEQRQFLV